MQWTVLIPAKALPQAKSRLATSLDAVSHADLVHAIRADTIAAARAAADVARVILVVNRVGAVEARGTLLFVQTAPGLNAALTEAAVHVRKCWPDSGTAAMVGDLPALRSADLGDALARAAHHDRSYVADSQGLGTTLLTAVPGHPLRPLFGPGSAARHGIDARLLAGAPGLRQDVDTAADLAMALTLGVGPATAAVTSRRHHPVHLDQG
ncbi:MAG: 2-phospho-L-lactate guanylyltransferase [Actinomycetota bacterium]|nr:2-phospho-L-lactate guanylyltransferase [Actinomycetota bacterium]